MPATIVQLRSADEQAISDRLGRARLGRGLDARTLRPLTAGARVRTLAAGERLWHAGDPGEHVGVIDRGAVTIASPRPSGRLAVLGVFGPDDCIGLPAILARTAYPAEAAALVAGTRVLCLVAAALHHAMASHPACAERVHAALHEHTSALRAKIEVLSAGTAAARLAAFLLYLADRFGAPRADGAVEVPLAVPRVKLADIIAARPETVIRTLGAWRRARLVWTTDDGFVIGARETLATLAERG